MTMQKLMILGTGVHGAEMAHVVARINRQWRPATALGVSDALVSGPGAR